MGVNDGTFRGQRYFFCPPKRALFVKLSSCQPDSRFQSHSEGRPKDQGLSASITGLCVCGTRASACVRQQGAALRQNVTRVFWASAGRRAEGRLEAVPPVPTEQVDRILIGRMKGIQGHCNSCYMDAALFRSVGDLTEARTLEQKCGFQCV